MCSHCVRASCDFSCMGTREHAGQSHAEIVWKSFNGAVIMQFPQTARTPWDLNIEAARKLRGDCAVAILERPMTESAQIHITAWLLMFTLWWHLKP